MLNGRLRFFNFKKSEKERQCKSGEVIKIYVELIITVGWVK